MPLLALPLHGWLPIHWLRETARLSSDAAVSRLIGAPPGYVGYGDGGLLTDAVRCAAEACSQPASRPECVLPLRPHLTTMWQH